MTTRTVTYLTHNHLVHLTDKAIRAGYKAPVLNRVQRLDHQTVFPVLFHFLHTDNPPVIRVTLMLSETDFVLLDMDLLEFNKLPRMDIDDSPEG